MRAFSPEICNARSHRLLLFFQYLSCKLVTATQAINTDPVAVRELKDETRRGLDLAHPHIVRIYDFVDDAENAAIAMEFVDGKSLAELRPWLVEEPLAGDALPFAVERVASGEFDDAATLDANYLRRTDAEIFAKPAVPRPAR